MLFFTTVHVGKGAVCQDRAYSGLGRRVGGWEGRTGNPRLAKGVWGFGLPVGARFICGCLR